MIERTQQKLPDLKRPTEIQRLILCSGKMFYHLYHRRAALRLLRARRRDHPLLPRAAEDGRGVRGAAHVHRVSRGRRDLDVLDVDRGAAVGGGEEAVVVVAAEVDERLTCGRMGKRMSAAVRK